MYFIWLILKELKVNRKFGLSILGYIILFNYLLDIITTYVKLILLGNLLLNVIQIPLECLKISNNYNMP